MSSDGVQNTAARHRRDDGAEKLTNHIRYSKRNEWTGIGLMPGTPAARKLVA